MAFFVLLVIYVGIPDECNYVMSPAKSEELGCWRLFTRGWLYLILYAGVAVCALVCLKRIILKIYKEAARTGS